MASLYGVSFIIFYVGGLLFSFKIIFIVFFVCIQSMWYFCATESVHALFFSMYPRHKCNLVHAIISAHVSIFS